MKGYGSRVLALLCLALLWVSQSVAAPSVASTVDAVRIDMDRGRIASMMKKAAITLSTRMTRPKDGWVVKNSPNANLCSYAKHAEDELNIYLETAESYTISEDAQHKEELYLLYNGDDELKYRVVIEFRK